MKIEKAVFDGSRVDLDGNEFSSCVFNKATLVYRGLGSVDLRGCTFENVSWVFDGPAANTINFLAGLYHGAGDGGRKLVEQTFENIRKAPPR